MSCDNHNAGLRSRVVSSIATLALWLLTALGAPAAQAVDSGDIVIVSLEGEVQVSIQGAVRAVRAGTVLALPASVRTGRDGAIELRQGATTVRVGPETLLDFPSLEKRGAPIDMIKQPRGNVFYDVGKRPARKLRVETPYLVGVVKGTQFSIAVGDDSTTVSLFEGLLEVRAAEGDAVLDLKAGEIATRRRGDPGIGVMKMADARAQPTTRRTSAGVPRGADAASAAVPGISRQIIDGDGHLAVRPSVSTTREVPGADIGGDTSVGTPVVAVTTEASRATDAGNSSVDVAADVAAPSAPVATPVGASVGAVVDVATSVSTDVGNVLDTTTRSDVDLGGSGASANVATGGAVDAGPVSVDVDTGLTIQVNNPVTTIERVVDTAAVNGSVSVNVGTAPVVDVNPPGGPPDLGPGLGLGLGLGLDLGLDASEPDTDTDSSTTDTATDMGNAGNTDVGELLDGLLRRPARR